MNDPSNLQRIQLILYRYLFYFSKYRENNVFTILGSFDTPVFSESSHFEAKTTTHVIGVYIFMLQLLNLLTSNFGFQKEKNVYLF